MHPPDKQHRRATEDLSPLLVLIPPQQISLARFHSLDFAFPGAFKESLVVRSGSLRLPGQLGREMDGQERGEGRREVERCW